MAEIRSLSLNPMCCQLLPASVDLYTPSPKETLLRVFDSPVPTQTTSVLLGARAMSPIEMVPWRSNIGFQVTPPFVAPVSPGFAFKAPHGGVENVWVGWIDIEVRDSVFPVDVKRPGPGLTAIGRHENAALFVWTECVSKRAYVNHFRILRMNSNGGDSFAVS